MLKVDNIELRYYMCTGHEIFGIWFSSLNHIYDEDVINGAPNDSNWGARPIRSLQEEQSKSFLDDLTFPPDKQRVVRCRSPSRRRYDTNFDYNRLLDEAKRAHERAEERDKKLIGAS